MTHRPESEDPRGVARREVSSVGVLAVRLDPFAVAETLDGHDVVSWYAGHWNHEHGDDGDWVGPRLRRIEP